MPSQNDFVHEAPLSSSGLKVPYTKTPTGCSEGLALCVTAKFGVLATGCLVSKAAAAAAFKDTLALDEARFEADVDGALATADVDVVLAAALATLTLLELRRLGPAVACFGGVPGGLLDSTLVAFKAGSLRDDSVDGGVPGAPSKDGNLTDGSVVGGVLGGVVDGAVQANGAKAGS